MGELQCEIWASWTMGIRPRAVGGGKLSSAVVDDSELAIGELEQAVVVVVATKLAGSQRESLRQQTT